MSEQRDRRPELTAKAKAALSRLSQEQREDLLTKCWMAFDSRWFMAVAMAYGPEAACRLNQIAAHEVGKVEAPGIARALQLPPVATIEDLFVLQEAFINLLGPKLMDYAIVQTGDDEYQIRIERCFAHENITRAGVGEFYDCGIFSRVTGWLEALRLRYEMTPPVGGCMKVQGRECAYTIKLLGSGG